jgi:hypothetical protein
MRVNYGIHAPRAAVTLELLFGRFRGLFYLAPVLILAAWGLVVDALRPAPRDMSKDMARRQLAWLALAIVGFYLALGSGYYMWDGGAAVGPRHCVPMLPVPRARPGPRAAPGPRPPCSRSGPCPPRRCSPPPPPRPRPRNSATRCGATPGRTCSQPARLRRRDQPRPAARPPRHPQRPAAAGPVVVDLAAAAPAAAPGVIALARRSPPTMLAGPSHAQALARSAGPPRPRRPGGDPRLLQRALGLELPAQAHRASPRPSWSTSTSRSTAPTPSHPRPRDAHRGLRARGPERHRHPQAPDLAAVRHRPARAPRLPGHAGDPRPRPRSPPGAPSRSTSAASAARSSRWCSARADPRHHRPRRGPPRPRARRPLRRRPRPRAGAEHIALAALTAVRDLDSDRELLYPDFIFAMLGEVARAALELLMNKANYEYQSDFARKYISPAGRGRRGKAEGPRAVLKAPGCSSSCCASRASPSPPSSRPASRPARTSPSSSSGPSAS